ncbi:MAG TPA: 50S ribosomal protein L16 [Candidatus Thermoplasmatota archaeon]|jgi:large subunit ribosomal protein L10e|nr:50S ribosomal protein L16 [Candidatus Thermoplasmatota archaeon]
MSRKPGSMYRFITQQAYTRREYIGGVPGSRITQFDLGDKSADFPVQVSLVAVEQCQIRHTALEACRVAANRVLLKHTGTLGYHLKIRVYPHHIIRENKQASGAGADRVSQGMRQSFGKPVGTAARVYPGQALLTIRCKPEHFIHAKEACRKATMKLPTPTRIVIDKGEDLVKNVVAAA